MCLVVGHMMGMELVEFPSATIGQGVLSMVITCVRRTMGKELLCSHQLLLGEESIVWWLRAGHGPSWGYLDDLLQTRSLSSV